MVKGMNGYGEKQRREQRRRNHVAKDLIKREYRQRRIEKKTWDEDMLKFSKKEWLGYDPEES